MILLLGNPDPREWVVDDETTGDGSYRTVPAPDGEQTTLVRFPDGMSVTEASQTMLLSGGVWQAHSAGLPSWVASDSDLLAGLIADATGAPVVPLPDGVA